MEFFVSAAVPFSAAELQQQVRIDNLPQWCASIDKVLSQQGERGEIYCLWGQFRIHREMICHGVRFTLPGCPNAVQWTVTAEETEGRREVRVHLTINRERHEPDFVESIETFLEDWRQGIERIAARPPEPREVPAEAECMPFYG